MPISTATLIMKSVSRRAAQVSVIHRLMEQGYSGAKVLRELQTLYLPDDPAGLGMRRQTFYRIWSPLKDMSGKVGKGVRVRPGDFPGAGTTTVSPFEQKRKYNYYVDVVGENVETGELIKSRITVASDVQLNRAVIEQQAALIWESGKYEGMEDMDLTFTFSNASKARRR